MTKKQRYRVNVGLNWADKRAEPGEVRSDIPPQSVHWLLSEGLIEEVDQDAVSPRS